MPPLAIAPGRAPSRNLGMRDVATAWSILRMHMATSNNSLRKQQQITTKQNILKRIKSMSCEMFSSIIREYAFVDDRCPPSASVRNACRRGGATSTWAGASTEPVGNRGSVEN